MWACRAFIPTGFDSSAYFDDVYIAARRALRTYTSAAAVCIDHRSRRNTDSGLPPTWNILLFPNVARPRPIRCSCHAASSRPPLDSFALLSFPSLFTANCPCNALLQLSPVVAAHGIARTATFCPPDTPSPTCCRQYDCQAATQ